MQIYLYIYTYICTFLSPYENALLNLERSLVQEGSILNLSQLNAGTFPKGFIIRQRLFGLVPQAESMW